MVGVKTLGSAATRMQVMDRYTERVKRWSIKGSRFGKIHRNANGQDNHFTILLLYFIRSNEIVSD